MPSHGRLDWARDGADWPNREHSRFVASGGLTWHVQIAGTGEPILLLHGTGATTHSWRDVLPLMARTHMVIAPDLPGHGFTAMPRRCALSLPAMAQAVAGLIGQVAAAPALVAGHSAGAAIAVRACLDGLMNPNVVVGLNAALFPVGGIAGRFFSPLARLLAEVPVTPRLFSRLARDPAAVTRLVNDTGSRLDARGLALYGRLASNPGHVAAALGMMAQWDLRTLVQELPSLRQRLVLMVGGNDRTVPPSEAFRAKAAHNRVEVEVLDGLGHLAHEEKPQMVARRLLELVG